MHSMPSTSASICVLTMSFDVAAIVLYCHKVHIVEVVASSSRWSALECVRCLEVESSL